MKNKNKHHYGTFAVNRRYFGLPAKTAKIVFGLLVILMLVIGIALALFNTDKKQETKLAQAPVFESSFIPGWWYADYFGASVCEKEICQPTADPDSDKLNNEQEYFYHSNPFNPDTNGNGLTDGEDVAQNFDPSKPGKITFEQAADDLNVLGESLVFDKDIKQMVAESQDLSRVNIPLVEDSELNIVYAADTNTYNAYADDLQNKIKRYFPEKQMGDLTQLIESGDDSDLENIRTQSRSLALELKKVKVPFVFLTFHKYNIAFFQLLAEVVPGPSVDYANNYFTPENDAWYDKAQAFLVIQQKLNFERELLNKQLSLNF